MWLSYSQKENGGYCFPCIFFAKSIDVRKGKGVFIETAFTNYKKVYLRGLTTSLQEEAKDIVQAISEINTLTTSLKEVRENSDLYHTKWYETVSGMCNKVGTAPSMPRLCGRQCHRSSTPASSPSEYFKRIISIPLLDHLLVELGKRFTSHQKTAFQGLYVVPSLLVKEDFVV